MRKETKDLILTECKIVMNKLGDISFDKALPYLQKDLWIIGNKYGCTGPEVLKILMEELSEKNKHETK